MSDTPLKILFKRYVAGQATAQEQEALFRLVLQPDQRELLETLLQEMLQQDDRSEKLAEPAFQSILAAITNEPAQQPVSSLNWRRWGWAAAILLLLGAGTLRWATHRQPAVASKINVIPPGKEGAILTLANGRQVVLDSLGNGLVALQNGTHAVLQHGQLHYDPAGSTSSEVAYNTLTTPKGRQFQLQLPDGTHVWLNAASSIRFPTRFTGRERLVEVTGEAYFEVVQDASWPLVVAVNDQVKVEVLGTHFNIHAYGNEQLINTTLLEGAVLVLAKGKSLLLHPGEQAQVTEEMKVLHNVNTDQVMAWKNGLFNFDGMHLREVMFQLERWYNVDITYEQRVPDVVFYGKLKRDISLQDLLGAFKDLDIHFKVEGRHLTVLP